MHVTHVLNRKSSKAVATITAETSVADAVSELASRRIGALVVVEGERVLGILSERDVVRALSSDGASVLSQRVSRLMTEQVQSCAPDDTADSVLRTMTEERFRHMPVMERGRMVGILSIGDVVAARMAEMAQENRALADMLSG